MKYKEEFSEFVKIYVKNLRLIYARDINIQDEGEISKLIQHKI